MEGHISLHQTENPTKLKLYYTVKHQYFFQHTEEKASQKGSEHISSYSNLMCPLWYWPMVNMWPLHTGFCILLSSTFEYLPITSNADAPFCRVKASRSDRMHQDKTNQNKDDSLCEGVCVPSGMGTSPQLIIYTAQCCSECTALEVFTVQP